MNDATRYFIGNDLKLEMYDEIDKTKEELSYHDPKYVEQVRTGLAQLIKDRELTMKEYGVLALVGFSSEDAMYAYLQRVYTYLFEDGTEPPYYLEPDEQ